MLIKFRTSVASIAFQPNRRMPPSLQATVEHDLALICHIYAASVVQGKNVEFWQAIRTFTGDRIVEMAKQIHAERSAADAITLPLDAYSACPKCSKLMPKGMKCVTCS